MTDEDPVYPYDMVDDADRRKIKIRAMRYLERRHSSTGMYHLAEENRVRIIPLKGGLPVARIATGHEADEIAAALHEEMPWMAPDRLRYSCSPLLRVPHATMLLKRDNFFQRSGPLLYKREFFLLVQF